MSFAHDLILQALHTAGVPFEVHRHHEVGTVEDAVESLPFPPEHLLKTQVFYASGHWCLLAARGLDRLDYRKVALALGVRRGDVRAATPQEVHDLLGFQPGGVGPFVTHPDARVLLDRKAVGLERVFCGVGRRDATLAIRMDDLQKVPTLQVADFTRDPALQE